MEPNYGYKHTRGFIVFLILILCGWVIVAHSQTSYTSNLNNDSWYNAYNTSNLTCWQAGDPGCSPGGIPYVRPGSGQINFSYTATELYQTRSITNALPNSGTGLMVTGFQYNWRSKNGNGWDDGALDTLQAYVQMYSKGRQWIESQTYSLNFLHNWTDFSWSGTFTKERRGEDLGTILYGFYGRDNNYWVGPYGPEITNVSFSLRYQPDPCVVNPLHSTDCPGFLKAIASPAYQAQESSAAIIPIVAATTSSVQSMSLPNMTSAIVKLTSKQEQPAQDTEIATGSSTMSSSSSVSVMMNQAATPVTVTRPRTSSADSTENTLSIDSLLEQTSTVQTITASTIAKNISSQTRLAPARDASTRSDNTPETVTLDQPLILMPQTTTSTTVPTMPSLALQSRITVQELISDNQTNYSLVETVPINTNSQFVNLPVQTPIVPSQSASMVETATVVEPIRAAALETSTADSQSNLVALALIDRTNPLNDALNGRQQLAPGTAVFAGPSVKPNTQDNDLASGVSISQITTVPVGFDVYQNLAIQEIAFYQPREIYRGQRTVDNVRALRSLGQDAKHQEMIDQQYRR
jgi:hypothetical protein